MVSFLQMGEVCGEVEFKYSVLHIICFRLLRYPGRKIKETCTSTFASQGDLRDGDTHV